jgi:hypothetical protein
MKILLLFLSFSFLALSCEQSEEPLSDILESEATLTNVLPADGCDWHFVLANEKFPNQFAFGKQSESLVKPFIDQATNINGLPAVIVKIKYQTTKDVVKVQCGWGKTTEMEEIKIVEIKKI